MNLPRNTRRIVTATLLVGLASAALEASAQGLPGGSREARSGDARVTLYGASWCPACHSARRYLERRGVAFKWLDVEQDPDALRGLGERARAAGLDPNQIPLIEVDGAVLGGFDEAGLARTLEEHRIPTRQASTGGPYATIYVDRRCGAVCNRAANRLRARGFEVTVRVLSREPEARVELDQRGLVTGYTLATTPMPAVYLEDREGQVSLVRLEDTLR